jgi:hypothetical protein
MLEILEKAYNNIGMKTRVVRINPRGMSPEQLYGHFD